MSPFPPNRPYANIINGFGPFWRPRNHGSMHYQWFRYDFDAIPLKNHSNFNHLRLWTSGTISAFARTSNGFLTFALPPGRSRASWLLRNRSNCMRSRSLLSARCNKNAVTIMFSIVCQAHVAKQRTNILVVRATLSEFSKTLNKRSVVHGLPS